MKVVKVGAGVLNQTPLDWEGNSRRIREAITEARRQGVGILCLPELCITGYGCEDAFHSPATHEMAARVLRELLPDCRGIVVSLGLPVMYRNAIFNTAAVVVDGRVAGFRAKCHLAGDGIHYEPRWFKAWPAGRHAPFEFGGETVRLGDIHFDIGDVRIGFEICEDAWVATRPGGSLALKGVDIILNPSASHFAFGKFEVRQRFVLEGSRAFGCSYVYANLVGNESGRAIYDGGVMIASGGRLLAQGPRFTFREVHVTTAVVDVDATRMSQARTASYQPNLDELPEDCVSCPFTYPSVEPATPPVPVAAWEKSANLKEEEFGRAVPLALFDYMRKSRSRGFVVSLSGGADSTACCLLVALMAQLALRELGPEGFLERLGYLRDRLGSARSARDVVRALLLAVYQATENSSLVTRDAAAIIADTIGAEFAEFSVGGIVKDYVSMIGRTMGRPLSWERDDIALQNIQARVRAPGVWLLANLRGALLVSTSNRSEAAVGYATMDGDTCGGISPIAGIDKAFLLRWLRWMETEGMSGLGPVPELSAVTRLAPTAELRPARMAQTDEDDLMPYPVLDAIERAAIRDKRSPEECWRVLRTAFAEYPPPQLALWTERFFRLWCRNQWKRERYAPSFHLDDENLDPKTWCRFPILSGGYERELAELRATVEREFPAAAQASG